MSTNASQWRISRPSKNGVPLTRPAWGDERKAEIEHMQSEFAEKLAQFMRDNGYRCTIVTPYPMNSIDVRESVDPAKRRFTVVSIYDADDTECGGDAYVKLIDENGKVVDEGDYYHNKINDRIEAFFETLDYLGVAYERVDVQHNESDGESS